MAFRNRFGWSISRESMFDACRRRYYFHYYLSWNGWNANAPRIKREAFKLKRLVSLPLWRGQLIHYIASKVLQSIKAKGRIPDKRDVITYTLERFESQYEYSRSQRYLTEPKKSGNRLNIDWLALFEHEYGNPVDSERLERIRRECIECIDGLFSSPILREIGGTDTSKWIIEDLDHAEFSQHFTFEDVTVYAKTDFIFRDRNGGFCIVDWKTSRVSEPSLTSENAGKARGTREPGKADANDETSTTRQSPNNRRDARVQLGVYGYYASTVLGIPANEIKLYEINLLSGGTMTEYTLNEETVSAFEEHITRGIERLSSVLVDHDRERNEPKTADHFPKIENGQCRSCNFFRICKDQRHPDIVLP
jgi:hypothetical protein